jgi:hypothetical protein
MVIAPDDLGRERSEQVANTVLDCARRRSPELLLKLCTANLLSGTHASFAPQRTIGVVEEVTRADVYRNVVMKGKVLAPFERLKPVDGDFTERRDPFELSRLNEKTMSSKARDMVCHRLVAAAQRPSDLPIARTRDDHHHDVRAQFRALLPIRS